MRAGYRCRSRLGEDAAMRAHGEKWELAGMYDGSWLACMTGDGLWTKVERYPTKVNQPLKEPEPRAGKSLRFHSEEPHHWKLEEIPQSISAGTATARVVHRWPPRHHHDWLGAPLS